MRRRWFGVLVAAVLLAPALVLAQGHGGGIGGGNSGGGGGGPPEGVPPEEEEEAGNNLSVPTIFVPDESDFFAIGTCTGANLALPSGLPTSGFEIAPTAFYYVQGENAWQADCDVAAVNTVTATADWGDNLTGDAPLKVGTPVRVEVRLSTTVAAEMRGYTVVKLEPSLLDRNSRYGILAAGNATDGWTVDPASLTSGTTAGVYTEGATFSICRADAPTVCLVPAGTAIGSEINATGNVLWGYLARFNSAGDYVITFTAPGVDLGGTSTVTQTISVQASAGGGGRKPR